MTNIGIWGKESLAYRNRYQGDPNYNLYQIRSFFIQQNVD